MIQMGNVVLDAQHFAGRISKLLHRTEQTINDLILEDDD